MNNVISQETLNLLSGFGYTISWNNSELVIKSKNSSSYLWTIILIASGIGLFIFQPHDPRVITLCVLLILFPLIAFRSNSYSSLVIYLQKPLKIMPSRVDKSIDKEYELDNFTIELVEYDRDSYTSPHEDGSKEYFVDIILRTTDGKKIELFHFTSRDKDELSFANKFSEQFRDLLHGYSR